MEISSDELYFVDFEDGEGKYLAFGEGEVGELLVENMENPHQFYADVLEKGAENVDDPKVIRMGSVSDLLDLDPDIERAWTYRLLPTAELFLEGDEGGEE